MSGTELKRGDRVVIIATNEQLRSYSCNKAFVTGSEHTIDEVDGTQSLHLDDAWCGTIRYDWVELANQYTDEDWV